MNRDSIVLLEYEASKRPFIRDLIDRIETVTNEEIEAAPWPLKWMREAFEKKRKQYTDAKLSAEFELMLPPAATHDINDYIGTVVEFTGDETWVKNLRGVSCLVKHGDKFFVDRDNQIWQGAALLATLPKPFQAAGTQTRREYILGISPVTEEKSLFRISRI